MKLLFFLKTGNQGQTLIETVAAIFILTMGITSALGLATFSLTSTRNVTKQIIAAGLAREGVEAVKNMRDTNWLQQAISPGSIDKDCYNFASTPIGLTSPAASSCPNGVATGACCYKSWLGDDNLSTVPYCLNPTRNQGNCNGSGGSSQAYNLGFDSDPAHKYWTLTAQLSNDKNYGLNFDSSSNPSNGFYYPGGPGGGQACINAAGMSDYCRKIIITKKSDPPYNQDEGSLVQISSRVWWVDKKCPRVPDWDETATPPVIPSSSCRLELNIYLTNWKNY